MRPCKWPTSSSLTRTAAGAGCCGNGARGMQSERHPGVNDAGFRTCRAVAAAPAPPAHTSHCRRSRGPANPYGTYRLDAGDRVRVILFGQDKLSRSYSVDSNGTVSLPLIGPVRARGAYHLRAVHPYRRGAPAEIHQGPQSQRRGRGLPAVLHPGRSQAARRLSMSTP